jgi:malic enzyme
MITKNNGHAKRPTFTDQEALLFHSQGRPGKLEVIATKPMATQRDLSLAYSPGVAVPVLAIAEDEGLAYDYTTKGNFVAVITNGTAILGLGNRGALAAKPVMEGKSVLFKRFADIDSIDLEVSTEDPTETSRRRNASSSSRSCVSCSISRFSTTISTAPPSSPQPGLSTRSISRGATRRLPGSCATAPVPPG